MHKWTHFKDYSPSPGSLLPHVPSRVPLHSNYYLYTLGGIMEVYGVIPDCEGLPVVHVHYVRLTLLQPG